MSSFKFVPQLGNTATFFDWFNSYNVTARDKMNSILISRPFKGDGITFSGNTTDGGYTFSVDDTINKSVVFNGNVQFNGLVNLSNVELSNILIGVTGNFIPFGVTAGSLVRIGSTGGLTLAKADQPASAESVGVAVSVDTSKTIIAVAGKISGTTFTNYLSPGGFSLGCVYFLDPTNAGGVTRTEPIALGKVSKPVLIGLAQHEAIILPYRGQYINDDGISGDNSFNSTFYASVESIGETLGDFKIGVGTILAAADKSVAVDDSYNSYPSAGYSFFKAKGNTERKYIIGVVTEILEFSSTPGNRILLKVNCNGSVISDATSLNLNWATLGSDAGLVYLDDNGNPSQVAGALRIGTVIGTDFVFDILSPTTTFFDSPGTNSEGSVNNLMINGSLSLWQRGRGVTTPYGITTGTTEIKQYIADKWVMWAGKTSGFTASRQNFTNTQTEVLGYPKHYISLIKNSTPSTTPSFFYNVIDDVRVLSNNVFTLSFYVKTSGPTGQFNVRSIQNISTISGNSYINDTIHATFSADLNWSKKTVLIQGPSANSGITSSYSLVGIQLNENGKTFNFAQFMLQPGSQATDPQVVDVEREYQRAAKYYQRSYLPEELTGTVYSSSGSSTLNIKNAESFQTGPNSKASFYFPIKMNKSPTMQFYSLSGTTGDASVIISGVNNNLKNSSGLIGYGGCARFWIPQLPDPITVNETHQNSYTINLNSPWCQFDQLYFHYVADADTTIN